MKRTIFSLMSILMATFVSVNLMSCGPEDDPVPVPTPEPNPSIIEVSSLIIGTWQYTTGENVNIWTFNSDGTGAVKEGPYTKSFTYKNDSSAKTITMTWENKEISVFDIIELTENILVIRMKGESTSISLTKVANTPDPNTPDIPIVDYSKILFGGLWKNANMNEEKEVETFSFDSKTAGSIVYEYEYYPNEDDYYSVIAQGIYSINGNTLTVNYTDVFVYTSNNKTTYKGFTNGKNRTVIYTIVSGESNSLVIKDEKNNILTIFKYKQTQY